MAQHKHKHPIDGQKTGLGRPVGRNLHDHALPNGGRTEPSGNSPNHVHKSKDGTTGAPIGLRI